MSRDHHTKLGLGFGDCHECDETAIVKLNGVPLCLDHYDDALRAVSTRIGQTFDELGIEDPRK